jgi:hypothetical protein
VGDTIEVDYNKKKPFLATINSGRILFLRLGCTLFLIVSSFYAIVIFSRALFLFIQNKYLK